MFDDILGCSFLLHFFCFIFILFLKELQAKYRAMLAYSKIVNMEPGCTFKINEV